MSQLNQYEVLLCVYTIQDGIETIITEHLSDIMPAAEVYQFDNKTEALVVAEQLSKQSYVQSDDIRLTIEVYLGTELHQVFPISSNQTKALTVYEVRRVATNVDNPLLMEISTPIRSFYTAEEAIEWINKNCSGEIKDKNWIHSFKIISASLN